MGAKKEEGWLRHCMRKKSRRLGCKRERGEERREEKKRRQKRR